jgi:hypothetical protein
MDTFTTRSARPAGEHHHSAQGFCTVCGTAWPCWRGLREGGLVSLSDGAPRVGTLVPILAGDSYR